MTVISQTFGLMGQEGVTPRRVQMVVTDSLSAVTTANFINPKAIQPSVVYPTDIFDIIYGFDTTAGVGTYGEFLPTITSGVITLTETPTNLVGPVTVMASTTSATPGTIRAFKGVITDTATVITSGNLVGVRGEVDYVGASGGFFYGVQGKIIPTGTLSGSSWNAGVFGQLDISAATINAGQIAPIWGDYGANSHTLTNVTGMYGIAMTNTTAAVLAGQLYLYGGATNLLLLNTNAGLSGTTYFQTAGTGSGSPGNVSYQPATEALQISVNGTHYWLPLYSSNS